MFLNVYVLRVFCCSVVSPLLMFSSSLRIHRELKRASSSDCLPAAMEGEGSSGLARQSLGNLEKLACYMHFQSPSDSVKGSRSSLLL